MRVVEIPSGVLERDSMCPCPLCGYWISDVEPDVVLIRDRGAICLAHEECANDATGSQS